MSSTFDHMRTVKQFEELTGEEFWEFQTEEHARWRAGKPLRFRDELASVWQADPEDVFAFADAYPQYMETLRLDYGPWFAFTPGYGADMDFVLPEFEAARAKRRYGLDTESVLPVFREFIESKLRAEAARHG